MSHTGGEGGGKGGEGSEGGEGGGDGGEGAESGGKASGESWWMVTSVFVKLKPSQATRHVVRPCGGEDKSLETWYAQKPQAPFPSRSFSAVVLGSSSSKIQPAEFLLLPPQSGSQ